MRKWHRWIGTALGLFLLLLAATGTILQLHEIEEHGEERARPVPSQAALADPAEQLRAGLGLAGAAGARVASASVETEGGSTVVKLRLVGSEETKKVDLATGRVETVPARKPGGLVGLAKGLHTGGLLGLPGRVLGLAFGLGLLFLSVSGLWLWLQVFRHRSKAGRHAMFWS